MTKHILPIIIAAIIICATVAFTIGGGRTDFGQIIVILHIFTAIVVNIKDSTEAFKAFRRVANLDVLKNQQPT